MPNLYAPNAMAVGAITCSVSVLERAIKTGASIKPASMRALAIASSHGFCTTFDAAFRPLCMINSTSRRILSRRFWAISAGAGPAGVYPNAQSLDERGRVLERWGAHVVGLATEMPVKARVIPLRG